MSAPTESYLAELAAAEAAADAPHAEHDPEGTDRRYAVTRQLRGVAKRQRERLEKAVAEAREQARQELIAERQTEAAFRTAGVPQGPARALFDGVNVADRAAMDARVEELRSQGVRWEGMPEPAGPPPPDPMQVAVQQMQAAGAGGMPAEGLDLATRMRKMAANPDAYTDKQHAAIVQEYNRAVRTAERPSYGANGA
jgi:hypothetical protein